MNFPRSSWLRALAAMGLVTAAVTGCGVRDARLQQSPLLDIVSPTPGRIAHLGNDGNVYLIDAGGRQLDAVTSDAGIGDDALVRYGSPTWSKDGEQLAYVRFFSRLDDTASGFSFQLIVADPDAPESTQQVFESPELAPIYLYWSPDGAQISMLARSIHDGRTELGVVSIADGGYMPLDSGSSFFFSWAPAHKALLAHANGDARMNDGASLSLIELSGGVTRSDVGAPPHGFRSPAISPSGRHMLFVTGDGYESQLVLRDLDGQARTAVAAVPGYASFAFSPSGQSVALLRSSGPSPSPDGQLTVHNLDTGDEYQFADDNVVAFFWAPDGRHIAYLVPLPPEELELVGVEFARDLRLLYAALKVSDVRADRTWTVARFPLTESFLKTHLQFFDQYARSATIWSSDSKRMVFTAYNADGNTGIYVASASGNLKPNMIAEGDYAFWSP